MVIAEGVLCVESKFAPQDFAGFHLLGPCMNEACSTAASPWTELFNLASKWEVLMLSERLMTEALQASRSQLNQYF